MEALFAFLGALLVGVLGSLLGILTGRELERRDERVYRYTLAHAARSDDPAALRWYARERRAALGLVPADPDRMTRVRRYWRTIATRPDSVLTDDDEAVVVAIGPEDLN